MLLRKNFLPLVLILQLSVGQFIRPSVVLAQTLPNSSDQNVPLTGDQKSILAAAEELENAGENDLPQKTNDAFALTEQHLRVLDAKTDGFKDYDLSSLNLSLPEFMVTDMEHEVTVEIDAESGSLAFILSKNQKPVAKQILGKIKPIAFARDKELFVVLDQSGAYYSIDMGFAKTALFRAPLPTIHLFNSRVDFKKVEGKISLQFLNRNQTPYAMNAQAANGVTPLDFSQGDKAMRAGDVIVTANASDTPTLVEELARSVIRTQVYTAEALLSFVAFRLNPEQFELKIEDLMKALPDAPLLLSQATTGIDPAVKAAVLAIPEESMIALQARARTNFSRISERVDQFTFQEWLSHAQYLRTQASSEVKAPKIPVTPGNLLYRYLNPRTLKIMAGVAVGGAGIYGIAQAAGGNGPVWAVHLVNQVYKKYIPAVLKDRVYRITLLKSSIALGSFVPLLWAAGFLGAKVSGPIKKTWSATKMVASMGMKVYAAVALPFYHRLANLTRQQSFLVTMRLGLNPLQTVKANSELGKKLDLKTDIMPGVNSPFWNKKNGDQSEIKAKAAAALVQENERIRTLAWMLSSAVVSEDLKVDPATLTLLAESAEEGGIATSPETMEQQLESPEFQAKWKQLAVELHARFKKLNDPAFRKEIEKVSPEEMGRLYEIAKVTAKKINSRTKFKATIANLNNQWRGFSESAARGIADFGLAENEFLNNAEPSDFVVSQFWKQFVIDYSLAIVQIGTIGARANLADPKSLAGDEHGPFYSSVGHFSEMAGQVKAYGITVPASLAMSYQRAAEIIEDAHLPIEDQSLQGVQKTENFFVGFKSWLGGAANLVEADYGAIWVRSLLRRIKTIQAGYVMSLAERMALGHRTFVDSTYAYIYSTVWGTWQYGWMWEPITRGNQIYQDHLTENAATLTEIKSALGTAIRLSDPVQTTAQMKALAALYEKSPTQIPAELNGSMEQMFAQLENTNPTQLANLNLDFAQSNQQIAALRTAIVEGNPKLIQAARNELVSAYSSAGTDPEALATLVKLNAVSLLDFAMTTPPFAVKPHAGVEWFSTLLGAVATTYYATAMSVETFRQDIPWPEKIGEAAVLSTALYAGTYYFPRIWKNALVPAFQKVKTGFCETFLSGNGSQTLIERH